MSENGKFRIVVTEGDPAGIGPEVVTKALAEWERRDCAVTIAGFPNHFKAYSLPQNSELIRPRNSPELDVPVTPGEASEGGAKAALASLDHAIDMVLRGKADAICTAPINKQTMRLAGFTHPGHTEYLAERAGAESVAMMLVGGGLRVTLATIHIPLAEVPAKLSTDGVFKAIQLTHNLLTEIGITKPRIGVAGLNPHAGESGLFGREEIETITPAIRKANSLRIGAVGPISADTLFHRAREGEFDACIAMYHDQGLIPIKTLDFHGGVNVTLGLPFIRTSPDHGTAYDLAGKNQADPRSMIAALELAYQMAKGRRKAEASA